MSLVMLSGNALARIFIIETVAQTSKSAVSRFPNPQTLAMVATSDLEIGDTAGLETCATLVLPRPPKHHEISGLD